MSFKAIEIWFHLYSPMMIGVSVANPVANDDPAHTAPHGVNAMREQAADHAEPTLAQRGAEIGLTDDRRRYGRPPSVISFVRDRGGLASSIPDSPKCLILGPVDLPPNGCFHIGRAIGARETGVKDELGHPGGGLNFDLQDVRLRREQHPYFSCSGVTWSATAWAASMNISSVARFALVA
jgi:hypothetical protein